MADLPKGLSVTPNGYLRLRVFHRGVVIEDKTLGPATPENASAASIYLSRIREKLFSNKFGLPIKEKEVKFNDIAALYLKLWCAEKDANGQVVHTAKAIKTTTNMVNGVLIPYFGKMWFDAIKPKDVVKWRAELLERGLSGTTVNRYQNVLSSLFSHIDRWSKTEAIEAVKRPTSSPTEPVEHAPMVKRERVPTPFEFKRLKLAFRALGDTDGEEICVYLVATALSEGDLRSMRMGQTVDLSRAKTGVDVSIPITLSVALNWQNWRNRWVAARKAADLDWLQTRDLRKFAINQLKGKFDLKLVSEYAGHASTKTTEASYTIKSNEQMIPLADELMKIARE